jgi:hypothetical protein
VVALRPHMTLLAARLLHRNQRLTIYGEPLHLD